MPKTGKRGETKNWKSKSMTNEKLRKKIEKLISKYERKNQKQEKVLNVSKNAEKELKSLLKRIPSKEESENNNEELVQELKNIHQKFRESMKNIKMEQKNARKEAKNQRKEEKKHRKELKQEKVQKLEDSRVEELPELKDNSLDCLHLIVDGWNIVGCDTIARKAMRGKRGKGAKRMIHLLSKFGEKLLNSNELENYNLEIHFDGKGKSEVLEINGVKINVKWSGKEEIVDDRLVRELGANMKVSFEEMNKNKEKAYKVMSNPNRKYLVVTSDRELSVRLNKIGVTVMKSGCFYKKYLKEFEFTGLEEVETSSDSKNGKNTYDRKSKGDRKTRSPKGERGEKGKKCKKHKHGKGKGKKHWKKYIKNRFSDNSTSTSSSSSTDSMNLDESDHEFDVIKTNE
jgi:hypothetical protein